MTRAGVDRPLCGRSVAAQIGGACSLGAIRNGRACDRRTRFVHFRTPHSMLPT